MPCTVIQFETLDQRMLRADTSRRRSSVEWVQREYSAWEAGDVSLEALCTGAGDALDAYASVTCRVLLRASRATFDPAAVNRILLAHSQGISQVGVAIRDAISDPSARHAVAQRLQERILRTEADFHDVVANRDLARFRA
jgi:hypothetical protein